jgi:hypothetical protein
MLEANLAAGRAYIKIADYGDIQICMGQLHGF